MRLDERRADNGEKTDTLEAVRASKKERERERVQGPGLDCVRVTDKWCIFEIQLLHFVHGYMVDSYILS